MKCPKCGSTTIYEQGNVLQRNPIEGWKGFNPIEWGAGETILDTFEYLNEARPYWCGNPDCQYQFGEAELKEAAIRAILHYILDTEECVCDEDERVDCVLCLAGYLEEDYEKAHYKKEQLKATYTTSRRPSIQTGNKG